MDLESEVVAELRERTVAEALGEVRKLEQQGAWAEALSRARKLADEYADLRSWPPYLARLSECDRYCRAMELCDYETAKQMLAAVIVREPDNKDAVSALHMLVNGVNTEALKGELAHERSLRAAAEARVQAAERAAAQESRIENERDALSMERMELRRQLEETRSELVMLQSRVSRTSLLARISIAGLPRSQGALLLAVMFALVAALLGMAYFAMKSRG
jgi:hypothetical protein